MRGDAAEFAGEHEPQDFSDAAVVFGLFLSCCIGCQLGGHKEGFLFCLGCAEFLAKVHATSVGNFRGAPAGVSSGETERYHPVG